MRLPGLGERGREGSLPRAQLKRVGLTRAAPGDAELPPGTFPPVGVFREGPGPGKGETLALNQHV